MGEFLASNFDNKTRMRCSWILLALLIVFASAPAITPINSGDDSVFHLFRIEGIAQGLRDGVFPVRIQYSQMQGLGYPVSIMYPDAFLYIPAIFRLIGLSSTVSYRLFIIIVNVYVVISTYVFSLRFSERRCVAFAITCVWTLGTYRLVDLYLRASVGEYLALAFYPMIAYGLWCSFTSRGRKTTGICPCFWIAFGMAGVVLSHVLSVVIAGFALIGVLLVLAIWGDRKGKGWSSLLSACGITLALTAWFTFPFLQWYATNDMNVKLNEVNVNAVGAMAGSLTRLLELFPILNGMNQEHPIPLSLGIGAMLLVIIALLTLSFMIFGKKKDKNGIGHFPVQRVALIVILICFLFLVLLGCSSILWKDGFPFMSKLAIIQFPWRFLGAILFVSVVLGLISFSVLTELKLPRVALLTTCAIVCLFTVVEGAHSMASVHHERPKQTSIEYEQSLVDNINGVMSGEYLPSNVTLESIKEKQKSIVEGDFEYEYSSRSDNGRVFDVSFDEPSKSNNVEIPLIFYEGYQIISSDSQSVSLGCTSNGFVQLNLPQGFTGTVSLKWVEPNSWHVAELISFVSIIGVVIAIISRKSQANSNFRYCKML